MPQPSNKNPIPSSPPKITPVVVAALQSLLVGGQRGSVLAQLLLLEQDVNYVELVNRKYLVLSDFISEQPSPAQTPNKVAREDVEKRFIGDDPWSLRGKCREREFLDAQWCQDFLDALFGLGDGYLYATEAFTRCMDRSGTGCEYDTMAPIGPGIPHWDETHAVRTRKELEVRNVAATLMEKPQWETRVDSNEIVERWKSEAAAQGLDRAVVNSAVRRTQWIRKTRDALTGSIPTHISGVYVSDSLVDNENLLSLKDIAVQLEDIPDIFKDWHPGSNGQILDLVDPSLYPYVRGRTARYVPEVEEPPDNASRIEGLSVRILNRFGKLPIRHLYGSPDAALESFGQGLPTSDAAPLDTVEFNWPRGATRPPGITQRKAWYQWLPTDVSISLPATKPTTFPTARFLSYINNLHPRSSTGKEKMYPILERIFARFIPMFQMVLYGEDYLRCPVYSEQGSKNNKRDAAGIEPKRYIHPEAHRFTDSDQLQVIVKMANIHLTPKEPDYPGGSWHVEGTDTERICATGIYYYDSENIATPKLSFRAAINPEYYSGSDSGTLAREYGISQYGPANQFLGSVVAQQGRCICFPNNMQHRVEPFSLADRTKPGHQKILTFFLIDPLKRVLSTSDVPPQQFWWFASEVRRGDSRLARLPKEIFDMIMGQAAVMAVAEGHPWPMPSGEALKHRKLLMEERRGFAIRANVEVYERTFDF